VKNLEVIQGDITEVDVDAIVNAANESLLGGGGVDGAIHRAAGPGLLEECIALNGCLTGQAKITGGHRLKARHVIHTVGPIYGEENGEEARLLWSCYESSLRLADQYRLQSVAFPAISTGIFGYPAGEAATIAVDAVRSYLLEHPDSTIQHIIFVTFSEAMTNTYKVLL
jgi:O-acetyl-ADP-ribose deacetylase (regulator of RNase III)